MRTIVPLLVFSLGSTAHAFCGTYVGSAGSDLFNTHSQLLYVLDGGHTTLTLANDLVGDVTELGLVIPVPSTLEEGDVGLADPAVFAVADAYSSPRLVEYTCDDIVYPMANGGGGAAACTAGEDLPPTHADGVTVEAAFSRGEYDLAILSATGGDGLQSWLDRHGFETRGEQAALLDDLVQDGLHFLVAKVSLDRAPRDGEALSPLRLRYPGAMQVIPIRLGATSSKGSQDMVLYAVGRADDGGFGVANYPEAIPENECLWRDDGDFGGFYARSFGDAVEAAGGTAWVREYQWGGGKCDPCTGEPPARDDLQAMGYSGPVEDVIFTRIHLRMRVEDVDQDLLVTRSPSVTHQQRYIRYLRGLDAHFPVCGEGWTDDPPHCEDRPVLAATPSPWSLGLLLIPLLGLRRRR